MADPDFSYFELPDATPEAELSSLAGVYGLIIDSAKKRGRLPDKSGPDAGKEINERSGKVIIPK